MSNHIYWGFNYPSAHDYWWGNHAGWSDFDFYDDEYDDLFLSDAEIAQRVKENLMPDDYAAWQRQNYPNN